MVWYFLVLVWNPLKWDTIILNQTIDEDNEFFKPVNKIWENLLGTDSYDSSLYENGLIDPNNTAGGVPGASLFTRIGNHGNDFIQAEESPEDCL